MLKVEAEEQLLMPSTQHFDGQHQFCFFQIYTFMFPVLYPKRVICLGYILSQSCKCQSPKRSLLSTILYRVVSA